MNIVLALMKRDFLKIKNLLSIYLSIFLFSPLLLYLFISIPLSLIIDMKPIYLSWSSSGIWIVTTIYLAYLTSFYNIKQNFESESFMALPILSWQKIISHYLFIIIIFFLLIPILSLEICLKYLFQRILLFICQREKSQ